jgi:hypothetical protein
MRLLHAGRLLGSDCAGHTGAVLTPLALRGGLKADRGGPGALRQGVLVWLVDGSRFNVDHDAVVQAAARSYTDACGAINDAADDLGPGEVSSFEDANVKLDLLEAQPDSLLPGSRHPDVTLACGGLSPLAAAGARQRDPNVIACAPISAARSCSVISASDSSSQISTATSRTCRSCARSCRRCSPSAYGRCCSSGSTCTSATWDSRRGAATALMRVSPASPGRSLAK